MSARGVPYLTFEVVATPAAVGPARRWMLAFHRACASRLGSTAPYPPRRRVRIASRTYAVSASTYTITDVCPWPVLAPRTVNRLGKPWTVAPLYAAMPVLDQASARLRWV